MINHLASAVTALAATIAFYAIFAVAAVALMRATNWALRRSGIIDDDNT